MRPSWPRPSSASSSAGPSPAPRSTSSGSASRWRWRCSPPAISSTAYATEEILLVLMLAVAFPKTHSYLVPIGIMAAVLLFIVLTSYRQTIRVPERGGAYIVSKENINATSGLVAGSCSSTTRSPWRCRSRRVSSPSRPRCLRCDPTTDGSRSVSGFLVLMTVGNLRGLKEAGKVFAIPTYVYVVLLFSLLPSASQGSSCSTSVRSSPRRSWPGSSPRRAHPRRLGVAVRPAAGVLVGCGRPVRCRGDLERRARLPQARVEERGDHPHVHGDHSSGSASWGSASSPTCSVVDEGGETVLSQMGKHVFGETPIYYAFQIATFAILILAANTAFAGFPQLSSIIARDGYLPSELANYPATASPSRTASSCCPAWPRCSSWPSGRGRRAHPALCGGRVHRVHAVPVRDGAPPPRAGNGLAAGARDQLGRLPRHRHRPRRRRGVEVHAEALGSRRW